MKKTLTFLFGLFCLTSAITLFAGKPVTVKSGNISVLKESSTAHLEIDFSNAKVDNKSLAEHLRNSKDESLKDLNDAKGMAEFYFTARFNNYSGKRMYIKEDVQDVDYKIVVRVSSIDVGNDAGAFIPYAPATAGGMALFGTVDIIDMNTKNVVCTINVENLKGESSPSIRLRMILAFQQLAESMRKLK